MTTAPSSRRQRRRVAVLLIFGVSVATTGLIAAVTVAALAATVIAGHATWSGAPAAASILGTAAGTSLLTEAMRRWGRRRGLVAAYAVAALGAAGCIVATALGSLAGLVGGMFVIGLGHAANPLSRYLIADLFPAERRGSALSWAVWAGTIGAVVGPNLLDPSGRVALALSLPAMAGAYGATFLLFAASALLYLLFLHPDPSSLVVDLPGPAHAADRERHRGMLHLFRNARVQVALVSLVIGQVVMVLIMTMTPVTIQSSGLGLDAVGRIISAHVVGMFVLAPLTGRLVDRAGHLPVLVTGQGMLIVAALLAASAAPTDGTPFSIALFLLGLGWNFGFVAGSGMLASGGDPGRRARLQGRADSLVWISAATASLASSLLLAVAGFPNLCYLGALLVLLPLAVLVTRGRALRPAAEERPASTATGH